MMTQHLLITASAGFAVAGLAALWPRRWAVLAPARSPWKLPAKPVQPLWLVGAAGGGGLAWALFGGAFFAAVGAGVGLAGAVWLQRTIPTKDSLLNQQLVAGFPLVLGFLAAVVEAGAPVRFAAQAVADVVDEPNAQRLRAVLARCDVGFSDAQAWRLLGDDPVWSDIARDLSRCVETGTATREVLQAGAKQAGRSAAAAAITAARSVGVSSTLPLVCCFLPAFLLVGVVPIIGGLIGSYAAGL